MLKLQPGCAWHRHQRARRSSTAAASAQQSGGRGGMPQCVCGRPLLSAAADGARMPHTPWPSRETGDLQYGQRQQVGCLLSSAMHEWSAAGKAGAARRKQGDRNRQPCGAWRDAVQLIVSVGATGGRRGARFGALPTSVSPSGSCSALGRLLVAARRRAALLRRRWLLWAEVWPRRPSALCWERPLAGARWLCQGLGADIALKYCIPPVLLLNLHLIANSTRFSLESKPRQVL